MSTQTQAGGAIKSNNSSLVMVVGMVVLLVIAGFLLFYRLGDYPAPWYDEGSHLHVAKNLALNGVYADYSSEGNRPFGPAVGVGPTVMLPIALLFKLIGVSIPLARVVIVIYGVLALGALYLLASRLVSPGMALLATSLVFLSPGVDFIFNSRTVLGEVPGLFFLLLGLWVWLKPGRHSILNLLASGALIGLACITKNQYALFILPSLFLAWIADIVWYRQRGWLYFVIPGIIAGLIFFGWTFLDIMVMGEQGGNFTENFATLRAASSGAFFLFEPGAMLSALRFLAIGGSLYAFLTIPGLVYGVIIGVKRDEQAESYGILLIFIAIGLGLFISSLAWERYAFAPVVLSSIFVVRLFQDLQKQFVPGWNALLTSVRQKQMSLSVIVAVVMLVWLVGALALPLVVQTRNVLNNGSNDAYLVAQYIDDNIPQDAVVETWEQELAVLTNHRYHYPPQITLAKAVASQWQGGEPASDTYDFRDYSPDYLVIGAFGKYTGLYPDDRLSDYELMATIGSYDVYRKRS